MRPYDFDFDYQLKDVDVAVKAYRDKKQNDMESIRFHAFLVMQAHTDKLKRPDQLCKFPWEDKGKDYGLRGMPKDEWLKEIEEFNKRSGTGYN